MRKEDVISLYDYYEDAGAREASHRAKQGDGSVYEEIADAIVSAGIIPAGAKLVPIPSSSGEPTNNLLICNWIALMTDAEVVDCVRGAKRESLYGLKKDGFTPSPDFFGFHFIEDEPDGPCVIFDAVVDRGDTMRCVSSLFQKAEPTCLAYAMTDKNLLTKRQQQVIETAYSMDDVSHGMRR